MTRAVAPLRTVPQLLVWLAALLTWLADRPEADGARDCLAMAASELEQASQEWGCRG